MRPVVHLTPPSGWMNDSYGVAGCGDGYELFCQAVVGRTTWARECTWARATSPDLVHWTWDGPALEPEPFEAGCWSGCVVPGLGALYTRVAGADLDLGTVALARREGNRFRSSAADVVLEAPPGVSAFRDPFVVARDGGWTMLVGAGRDDGTGAVLEYRSADLAGWEYTGVLARIGEPGRRTVAECPQLVEVDGRWALLVSVQADGVPAHVAASFVGDERWHRWAEGDVAYATTAFRDRDGRPCAMSWLRETHEVAGWAGAQSLPGVLRAEGDRLLMTPHPELPAGRPVDPREPVAAARFRVDPATTAAFTAGGRRFAVSEPAEVVVDADLVEVYAASYAAWRTPPAHEPRPLAFEGDVPDVGRLG